MKFYPLLFSLAALGLLSCQSRSTKEPVSISEEPKSIIYQWYGPNHFDPPNDTDNCDDQNLQNPSNTTPAGNIFSKQFIEQHRLNSMPEPESFFSHYLFQDASDIEMASLPLAPSDDQ